MTAGGIRHDLETIVDVASDDGQPVFTIPRPCRVDARDDLRAGSLVGLQFADRFHARRHATVSPRRQTSNVSAQHPVVDPHLADIGIGRVVVHADTVLADHAGIARFQVAPESVVAAGLPGVADALRLTVRALAAAFAFALTALTLALTLVAAVAGPQRSVILTDLESLTAIRASAGVVGVGVAPLALTLALGAFALTLALVAVLHVLLTKSTSTHDHKCHRHQDHPQLEVAHPSTSSCSPLTDRNRALDSLRSRAPRRL